MGAIVAVSKGFRVKPLAARVKRGGGNLHTVEPSQTQVETHMRKYIVLSSLTLLILTCAALEGLVELSPQFIQINGLLIIVGAGALISWVVKKQVEELDKD